MCIINLHYATHTYLGLRQLGRDCFVFLIRYFSQLKSEGKDQLPFAKPNFKIDSKFGIHSLFLLICSLCRQELLRDHVLVLQRTVCTFTTHVRTMSACFGN